MWVQNPVNNFFIAHLDSDGCWVVWRSFQASCFPEAFEVAKEVCQGTKDDTRIVIVDAECGEARCYIVEPQIAVNIVEVK